MKERVPEIGGRHTESSVSEEGWRADLRQRNSGSGIECDGRGGQTDSGGEGMKGFVCEKKEFVCDGGPDWEPMEVHRVQLSPSVVKYCDTYCIW